MATTVELEYFLRDVGRKLEDDNGVPIIVYYPKHMYTSEITSAHNKWEDAIKDVAEFMDIEVTAIERLKPLQNRVYRVHTKPNGEYLVVWAKIRKDTTQV